MRSMLYPGDGEEPQEFNVNDQCFTGRHLSLYLRSPDFSRRYLMPPKNKARKGKKADDDDGYWLSLAHRTANQSIGKRPERPSLTTISPFDAALRRPGWMDVHVESKQAS